MSTTEEGWEFGVSAEAEDVEAPRADRRVNPAERVTGHSYESGVIELRSAKDGEYLTSTRGVPCVEDHR